MEKQYLSNLQKIKQNDVEVLLKKAYRGIWETAIKKYSDSAHFVYELLQNADDAKATWVEFILDEEGLWFKQNGSVRFTISDPKNEDFDSENGRLGHINAITSIGNSTKIDEQKIGKFGIGFKAVFAYSLTPHIYDDNFNFKLENYIVPIEIPGINERRKAGETLFYFPFNHNSKTKIEAYDDIEQKLESLFHPILFLTNLTKIKWVSQKKNGIYSREVIKDKIYDNISASLVELTTAKNNVIEKDQIWLLSREVINFINKSNHRIVVGFFLNEKKELKTLNQYTAFCFFPTKEETKLTFITQAPFLLTDSREGIRADDQWNIAIVEHLAELTADALPILKQIEATEETFFLGDNILELIPYRESDFSEINNKTKISFKPFYNQILNKLLSDKILPGRNGKYFETNKSYWASDPELGELFSDEQISLLMENPESGLVFATKGQKQLNQVNKALETYINKVVNETVDPKKLLRRITSEFIEAQSDEWLLRFYSYLEGRKSLWDDKEKLALKKPILLNQDRKAVSPFDDTLTTPNIFLPTDRVTSYDTIYKDLVDDEKALDFFKSLGLGKPDLRAEIYKTIIPQYKEMDYENAESLLMHLESFLSYYEICKASEKEDYLSNLKEISFIASINSDNPNSRFFCQPEMVYFKDQILESYFINSPSMFFLDEDFYKDFLTEERKDKFYNFLTEIGVSNVPRVNEVTIEVNIETKEHFGLDEYETSLTYSNYQTINDKVLDGLDGLLDSITLERSVILWNYLLFHFQGKSISSARAYLMGSFNFVPKYNTYSRTVRFESTLASKLKSDKWLFDKDNNLLIAQDHSKERLNRLYNTDHPFAEVLLEFIGLKNPDNDLQLTPEQKQALNIGRKLMEEGISQEDILEYIDVVSARKKEAKTAKNNIHGSLSDDEIENTLSKLKESIKNKRESITDPNIDKNKPSNEDSSEAIVDHDDYSKPAIDLQKKIEKLKALTEAQIEDLTRIEKLNEIVKNSEQYSFIWFKSLLELEYLSSAESNSGGKEISIQFTKVEKELGTERILILKHPNRYIPQSIEDIGDLQVKLFHSDESRSVSVEVVSVKEYTLRAKLKKSVDISGIDLNKITRAVIDVKNPVFILEELRKAFYQLNFEDNFNLQMNLTEKIRFIFGPPGTGKTTYLATNEIIPLMQRSEDLKVLVLTPTNKAADVLTKRIIEKMDGNESYYNWLLRFGTTGDQELENSSIVVDKHFDIRTKPKNTTISTIARFAYDYFQPQEQDDRLHLKFLKWDIVIIDEASMINLASIVYVLFQKLGAQFIIAGDPFQIQPITQIDQWKDMNIYDMVHLDKFLDPITVPHNFEIVNLKKQYRSIPTIGDVFSNFTYEGILEHHRSLQEQKTLKIKGLNFKDINIIKFPVSRFESIFKPNTLNKSNYHIYSALFTVEFVLHLAKEIDSLNSGKFRIGIICPYKAQATLVEKLFAQQHIQNDEIEIQIGTIHGFQGDECDLIVTIFNPPLFINKSPNMFLNKQNILNVSISRARDYLFIIMPDDGTQDIENLYKIRKIENLVNKHASDRSSTYDSEVIEEVMFGSKTYIYDNSFATSHQSVNVYSKPEKKYEIRCEEIAVDVQIKQIAT